MKSTRSARAQGEEEEAAQGNLGLLAPGDGLIMASLSLPGASSKTYVMPLCLMMPERRRERKSQVT